MIRWSDVSRAAYVPMTRSAIVAVAALLAAGCSKKDAPPQPAQPEPAASIAPAAADTPDASLAALAPATPASPASSASPHGADGGVATATGKPFGAPCVADGECAGTVCFHKRIKTADAGKERRGARNEPEEHDGYCSLRCDKDADCPVPLTRGKCGARGMCKRAND